MSFWEYMYHLLLYADHKTKHTCTDYPRYVLKYFTPLKITFGKYLMICKDNSHVCTGIDI